MTRLFAKHRPTPQPRVPRQGPRSNPPIDRAQLARRIASLERVVGR
jgi:hypothetical protein